MIERTTACIALGVVLIAAPAFAGEDCVYKGTTYSRGSTVCQSERQYRCDYGKWEALGIACAADRPVAAKSCMFDGEAFSPGANSCQSGAQYRCNDGTWMSLGGACTAKGTGAVQMVPAAARTCMYNGATVATESTICKSGVTFRCDDGEWLNVGTACR